MNNINNSNSFFVLTVLIAIFLIVIGDGCRARGKVGQNNIGSVAANKQVNNLAKNTPTENNLTNSVDNQNQRHDEILIPPNTISNSKIAQKNTPKNTQVESANHANLKQNNNNNNNSEIIIPPRQIESLAIEPKPLDVSNKEISQVNNAELQNHKNQQPEKQESNNTNKTKIKTVAASELSENPKDTPTPNNNGMSLQEFETILMQAKWQPNIQLEYWHENGMKLPENKRHLSRERQEQIKQLNLSDKEKLKNNQNQKYFDELISTWRWYNKDIDELVQKQLEPDLQSRPIFPVDPKIFLENDKYKNAKYNTLRANAAILMGRCNDNDAVETLIEIVKKENSDGIRCAAVETLGTMERVDFDELIPLLEFARKRNNVTNNHNNNKRNKNNLSESKNSKNVDQDNKQNQITVINRQLWSELLNAIANKITVWEHPCFLDSLATNDVEIRRTSARLWRIHSQTFWEKNQTDQSQQLPRRFLVFARSENDISTRIEMIKTLGIWKESEILDIVINDLNHFESRLRFAAMDAVAAAECTEAERILKTKLRDTSAKIRAKSAESLRKLGFIEDVLRLADDKERDVRIEVARAIALAHNQHTLTLAQRYIENDLEDIKLAALSSLAAWERIDLTGEVLIDALQNASPKVRKLSAEILSSYFPSAIEFLSKNLSPNKDRIQIIAKIKKQHNEYLQSLENAPNQNTKKIAKNNTNDENNLNQREIDEVVELMELLRNSNLRLRQKEEIMRQLSDYGDRLLSILEFLYENYEGFELPKLIENILADNSEIFGLILLLDSDSNVIRRKAAADLLRRSKVTEFGGLACSLILERGLSESDVSMLLMYLGILQNSDAYNARYFAASILKMRFNSVELQRNACNVFGEVGNGYDLIIVAQYLGDQRRDVAHAAFVSIVKILSKLDDDEFEKEREEVAAKLWSRFTSCDLFAQVEISAAIYLLGDISGAKSLLRESFSPDTRIRMHIVSVIGIMDDPDFMSVLIRYLDDGDTNVSQLALAKLPKLVGEDVGIIETKIPMEHELSQSQKKIARWKKWYKSNLDRVRN